jgi:EAL domain-containing protein (putative c-di-GMP-specific phosphodiesterase class I)
MLEYAHGGAGDDTMAAPCCLDKPLLAVDRFGTIEFASATAEGLLGFATGTLVGKKMDAIITADRLHADAETLVLVFEGCCAETSASFERIVLKADQSTAPVRIRVCRSNKPTEAGITVVVEDLAQAPAAMGGHHGLAAELARAVRNREFRLYYQPQACLKTGAILGVEALIRWQHPEWGLLQPAEFLRAIGDGRLEPEIGWWILDEACAQLARWHEDGLPYLKVAVNLFPAQFRSADLVGRVTSALSRNGLSPAALELEVTKVIALTDDVGSASVRTLRELGVGIAFDDFGTGYASLSSLRGFPLTTIKLDRSFIRDLVSNSRDAAIVRAIIAMAHDLNLQVIAEGIETAAQLAFLERLDCRVGQGYMFGKPMTSAEIDALMSAEKDANLRQKRASG